MPDPTLAIVK